MSRFKLLMVALFILVGCGIAFGGKASAGPWPSPYSDGNSFGRQWGTGYFSGQNFNTDVGVSLCQSDWAWPSGFVDVNQPAPQTRYETLPDNGNFKDYFINIVQTYLNLNVPAFGQPGSAPLPGNPASNKDGHVAPIFNCTGDTTSAFLTQANSSRTGSALLVDAMLGKQGTDFANYIDGINYAKDPANFQRWKDLVNEYAARPGGIEWNVPIDFWATSLFHTRADSAGQLNGYDAGFYGNSDPSSIQYYIVFNNPDGTTFVINKKCGNITGNASPLKTTKGPFTITPNGSVSLDDTENPRVATFKTGVNVTSYSGQVIASTTRQYFYIKNGNRTNLSPPPDDNNHNFNDGSHPYFTDTRNLPTLQAGDKVCVNTTVTPGSGTSDASGTVTNPGGAKSTGDVCTTVIAKPYIKAFGNDVSAGGVFAGTNGVCSTAPTNPKATILTIGKRDTLLGVIYTGAGSQLGAFALGEISQFTSAGGATRTKSQASPTPPVGLTFGNYGSPSILQNGGYSTLPNLVDRSEVDGYGGKSGISRCIPNYYQKALSGGATNDVTTNKTIPDVNALPADVVYSTAGSSVTINASTVSGQHVIAVNGDVFINGNIGYAGYGGVSGIPSLYVIATGNIYIAPGVKNLSGVYVAQPTSVSGTGTISTCGQKVSNSLASVDGSNIFSTCTNQLIVNGAFVAQKVQLLRTFGSLKNSTQGETATGSGGAETFIGSPEIYLSVPQSFRTSPPYGTYDSITSLPPVL